MDHIEGDLLETPQPKPKVKRTKTRSDAEVRRLSARSSQLKGVGKMIPACPMTADELAAQWEVGAEECESITVKVLRQVLGKNQMELITSVPLVHYDGNRIAANYGPGTYYLRPAAGWNDRHSAKIMISDVLAQTCGFGRIVKASVADQAAAATILQAGEGPTDPKALVMAVSQMMDAKLDAFRQSLGVPGQMGVTTMKPIDPMQSVETEMERMMRMMSMLSGLQEKARESVRAEMGIVKPEPPEPQEGSFWLELIKTAVPAFVAMVQARPAVAEPTQPVAPPQPPQRPAIATTQQEAPPMPTLTQDEEKALGAIVGMLAPFGGHLAKVAAEVSDDEAIVGELIGFVGDSVVPSLKALEAITKTHGPAVLAKIHPELATPRWVGIVAKLSKACDE